MASTERVEMRGHILNSGALSRVLDEILASEGDYVLEHLDVGRAMPDFSSARIAVTHDDDDKLE